SFLFYMPLPIDGWSLAILIPTNEALKGVNALMRNTLLIGLCGFVFLSVGTIFVVRRLTQPVRDLSVATLEIAKGNFNAPLPQTKSSDEVGQLSDSFGFMQTSLREYIVDLKETTTQKERIEAELRIARDIQMGILPKLFPAFPDHDEFDIYASLESAKEVGGDLYDFFFIDDHHFCFLVGDVSGKGVPAAFFMAVTKTLIKVIAERELQPDVILAKVNNDLAEDNESCMFVTLFLAVIDIRIGEVIYSSAGHNPPLLLTANEVAFMVPGNEPVAGAMPGVKYTSGKLTLASGDTMFLYTDGVTEAMNHEQKLYSEQRLLNLLTATTQRAATDIIHQVNRSIIEFASGAEQSDDITMLALTYTGGNNPPPRSDNDAI
ncbi:MAG: SpoIIE family protein phosphatase, partial [Thermodesulfobacteriota bacterium]|nr:SpoIIE family protein phosphatase [Thermodesulfobacteriota bacterium]